GQANDLRLSGTNYKSGRHLAEPVFKRPTPWRLGLLKGGRNGQRGPRIRIDGPREAARDRQQGRSHCASKGEGPRVDQRGGARSRSQGRARQSSVPPGAGGGTTHRE